jgi:hypothetical protein
MGKWSFLTNHAAAMVCIAHDPGVRLRDIAATLDITERSAFGIVTELVGAGYVVKEKEGRRNRYRIQGHLPMRDSVARERTIGEILDVLVKASTPRFVPPRSSGCRLRDRDQREGGLDVAAGLDPSPGEAFRHCATAWYVTAPRGVTSAVGSGACESSMRPEGWASKDDHDEAHQAHASGRSLRLS